MDIAQEMINSEEAKQFSSKAEKLVVTTARIL